MRSDQILKVWFDRNTEIKQSTWTIAYCSTATKLTSKGTFFLEAAPVDLLTLSGIGLDIILSASSLAGGRVGKAGVSTGAWVLGNTGT